MTKDIDDKKFIDIDDDRIGNKHEKIQMLILKSNEKILEKKIKNKMKKTE